MMILLAAAVAVATSGAQPPATPQAGAVSLSPSASTRALREFEGIALGARMTDPEMAARGLRLEPGQGWISDSGLRVRRTSAPHNVIVSISSSRPTPAVAGMSAMRSCLAELEGRARELAAAHGGMLQEELLESTPTRHTVRFSEPSGDPADRRSVSLICSYGASPDVSLTTWYSLSRRETAHADVAVWRDILQERISAHNPHFYARNGNRGRIRSVAIRDCALEFETEDFSAIAGGPLRFDLSRPGRVTNPYHADVHFFSGDEQEASFYISTRGFESRDQTIIVGYLLLMAGHCEDLG